MSKKSDMKKALTQCLNFGKSKDYRALQDKLDSDIAFSNRFSSLARTIGGCQSLANQYGVSAYEVSALREYIKNRSENAPVDTRYFDIKVDGGKSCVKTEFEEKYFFEGMPATKDKPGIVNMNDLNMELLETAAAFFAEKDGKINANPSNELLPQPLKPRKAGITRICSMSLGMDDTKATLASAINTEIKIAEVVADVAPEKFRPVVKLARNGRVMMLPNGRQLQVTEGREEAVVEAARKLSQKGALAKIANCHYNGIRLGNAQKYVETLCDLRVVINQLDKKEPIILHTKDRHYGLLFGNYFKDRTIYIMGGQGISLNNNEPYQIVDEYDIDKTKGFHIKVDVVTFAQKRGVTPKQAYKDAYDKAYNSWKEKYEKFALLVHFYGVIDRSRYAVSSRVREGVCWYVKGVKFGSLTGTVMKKYIYMGVKNWLEFPWRRRTIYGNAKVDMSGRFDFRITKNEEVYKYEEDEESNIWLDAVDEDAEDKESSSDASEPSSDDESDEEEISEEEEKEKVKLKKKKKVVKPPPSTNNSNARMKKKSKISDDSSSSNRRGRDKKKGKTNKSKDSSTFDDDMFDVEVVEEGADF